MMPLSTVFEYDPTAATISLDGVTYMIRRRITKQPHAFVNPAKTSAPDKSDAADDTEVTVAIRTYPVIVSVDKASLFHNWFLGDIPAYTLYGLAELFASTGSLFQAGIRIDYIGDDPVAIGNPATGFALRYKPATHLTAAFLPPKD